MTDDARCSVRFPTPQRSTFNVFKALSTAARWFRKLHFSFTCVWGLCFSGVCGVSHVGISQFSQVLQVKASLLARSCPEAARRLLQIERAPRPSRPLDL